VSGYVSPAAVALAGRALTSERSRAATHSDGAFLAKMLVVQPPRSPGWVLFGG